MFVAEPPRPVSIAPMMRASRLASAAVLALLLTPALPGVAAAAPPLVDPCFGPARPLVISSNMPYTTVRIGAASGYFVLDFASTQSTVDLIKGFAPGPAPQPKAGTVDQFDGFDFFGVWGTVRLKLEDHSGVQGTVHQAGIVGTDFLMFDVYTLDYEHAAVYRAPRASFCADAVLSAVGLRPLSTALYYASDPSKLGPGASNVPAVPVRVGSAQAVAQLDTGFDDGRQRHSVNVNRAFFDAIQAAGVKLQEQPLSSMTLSTCVPSQTETLTAYRLPPGVTFDFLATDGTPARSADDAMLFLKETPAAARVCGGIGTWTKPGAQVGASFYVDAKKMVFDPFSSRVWMGR
jgi:hypothetical protein